MGIGRSISITGWTIWAPSFIAVNTAAPGVEVVASHCGAENVGEPPPGCGTFRNSEPVASSVVSSQPSVRIVLLNCGGRGLRAALSKLQQFTTQHGHPDVLVFVETHMLPASVPELADYMLLWNPRPLTQHETLAGGVAFGIFRESTLVASATLEDVFAGADVAWMRVRLSVSDRMLLIGGVYLPPIGGGRVCDGCDSIQCRKSHVDLALGHIAEQVQRHGVHCDVIVVGDFNARAQMAVHSSRWVKIQEALLSVDTGLILRNPVQENGELESTRIDPSDGAGSVLDLVMVLAPQLSVTSRLVHDTDVSDHLPLEMTVQVLAQSTVTAELPRQYGFVSGVPSHLRTSHKLVPICPADINTPFCDTVHSRMRDFLTGDRNIDDTVAELERSVLASARELGILRSKPGLTEAGKASARAQRRIEACRGQLTLALQQVPIDGTAVSSLCDQLRGLTQERQQLLHARRQDQRQRRRDKTQRCMTSLLQPHTGQQRDFRSTLSTAVGGSLHFRGRRTFTPLATVQNQLHTLESKLRKDYHRDIDPQRASRWNRVLDDDIAAGRAKTAEPPPTLQEVRDALMRMNGSASALGIPVAALKKFAVMPALMALLHAVIVEIWTSGRMPHRFGLVRATEHYRYGPMDKPRILGVGTALSRLWQTVLEARLMNQLVHLLSSAQFGFLRGKATELCVFLANSMTACAQLDGETVDTVYLDIKGAFPSTRHDHIHASLRHYGVSADVRRLVISWYDCQEMFVQVGKLLSEVFRVGISVTQGGVPSPVNFIAVIDRALHRVHSRVLEDGRRLGMPLLQDMLAAMFYADDGRLADVVTTLLQIALDMIGEDFTALDFEFNAAPTKSAHSRFLPIDKKSRALARKRGAPQLILTGLLLEPVKCYKYLGVQTHVDGPKASCSAQLRHLLGTMATLIRQAASSPLRTQPLIYSRLALIQWWLPRVSYALGLIHESAPQSLLQLEQKLMRICIGSVSANLPTVCLRHLFGIPTLQTRIDIDRLRVAIRLLSQSAGSLERQQLVVEFMHANKPAAGRMLPVVPRLLELCQLLDTECDASFRAKHPRCPQSWVVWMTACILDYKEESRNFKRELAVLKWAMLRLEGKRRRWELERCIASLGEVFDVLDTPDTPPFVWCFRGDVFNCFVALRGGVRTLFGHQYRHIGKCVWCGELGGFTVPHLLRDCVHWETERRLTWLDVQNDLATAGVACTADCDSPQNRQLWYLFTCGASVPNSFVRLGLDAPTHFARGTRAGQSAAMRPTLPHYRKALKTLGKFVLAVTGSTTVLLQQPDYVLPPPPEQRSKRTTINHFTREAMWLRSQQSQRAQAGDVGSITTSDVSQLLREAVDGGDSDGDDGNTEALPYMADMSEYLSWALK
jgi:hypothetical protein